ncbi:MAG: hypothetical protein KQJ78_23105 [Deltaproteobacteria bacterium]|nr:hypothetical protein [Deltaproteobacteria bacterium]
MNTGTARFPETRIDRPSMREHPHEDRPKSDPVALAVPLLLACRFLPGLKFADAALCADRRAKAKEMKAKDRKTVEKNGEPRQPVLYGMMVRCAKCKGPVKV